MEEATGINEVPPRQAFHEPSPIASGSRHSSPAPPRAPKNPALDPDELVPPIFI